MQDTFMRQCLVHGVYVVNNCGWVEWMDLSEDQCREIASYNIERLEWGQILNMKQKHPKSILYTCALQTGIFILHGTLESPG